MDLKGRLELIIKKIPVCQTMCDIGTDHGYIPIYAVQNRICKKAVATDNKKGPIFVAQKNIKESGLDEIIETRIGSGLEPVSGNETDVVVIAGMGGVLIKEILIKGLEKAKKANTLVLQPMNAIEIVRQWLYENGFEIFDEELANEGEKIYNVIAAKWTGSDIKSCEADFFVGRKLVEKKDPLLMKYLNKKLKNIDKIIIGIEKSNNSEDIDNKIRDKCKNLKQEILKIQKEIS